MKRILDNTDKYYIFVTSKMLRFLPWIGASAAVTFTLARVVGYFSYVELSHLLCFDLACISYFVAAFFVRKVGIIKNGEIDRNKKLFINLLIDILVIVQWNLITYIFPTRDFWGFAPMFVLLTAFMFNSLAVLIEIGGITVSIMFSWVLIGDKLLPYDDGLYMENLILRVIALSISFFVIYVLTVFAEKFTHDVKDSFSELSNQNEELESVGRDIIDFTADIIEERDSTSGSHVKRLKEYTKILAEELSRECPEYELDEMKIYEISMASVLHDIGKIAIPDSILLKPGKLTNEEFEVIKTHTTLGAKIVEKLPQSIDDAYKKYCREICLYHHEKYDGKGYPVGLVGDDIPISAQIVSLVDCFDALTNERPYKAALPGEMAIKMIVNGECGAFSDKMIKCLLNCKEKLLNPYEE